MIALFLDDNPAERALVRELAPQVNVIELPDMPEAYSEILLGSGLFEAGHLTEEDTLKAEQYKANSLRESFMKIFYARRFFEGPQYGINYPRNQ